MQGAAEWAPLHICVNLYFASRHKHCATFDEDAFKTKENQILERLAFQCNSPLVFSVKLLPLSVL